MCKSNSTIKTDFFETLIGKEITVPSAIMKIDMDFNGKTDTEWVLKTDGTKSERNVEEITDIIISP